MNINDTPQQQAMSVPEPAPQVPDALRERFERMAVTSTPDALRAAQVTRDDKNHAITRGRGLEWVRPTDLIARHSAQAAGRGLDFQAELARRTRTPIGAGVRHLRDRARRLPPTSAFGRSSAPSSPIFHGPKPSPMSEFRSTCISSPPVRRLG